MTKYSRFFLAAWMAVGFLFAADAVRADAPAKTEPAYAAFIDGQPQSIPANATQWYKFEYAGDKSQITVLMPNAAQSLLAFNVFTPEQAQNWWNAKPIGRGTAYQIDCATGEEVPYGECQSNDLKWVGKFNAPGTYYVQVVNYNTGTANFTLTIEGTGVSVGAAAPSDVPRQPMLPVTGGVPPHGWSYVPRLDAPSR